MKQYDYIYDFENGFSMVCLNDKWGFIDTNGHEICEIKYDFVYSFTNGFSIVVLNGKWGGINKKGIEIIDIKYNEPDIDYILKQYIKTRERNLKLNKLI
jgi:hypothetical protein